MKNFKFLFLSLLLIAFLAPNVSNAQAVQDVPDYCNITLDGVTIGAEDAMVLISDSGNLLLKATFDVNGMVELKKKGTVKVVVERLAVLVYSGGDPDFHFQAFDVKVSVGSDGMATAVFNWQISEEY